MYVALRSLSTLLLLALLLPLSASAGLVNINTANQAELETLKGIGPSKAQAIIEYRSTNPFETTEEIQEVKGIGPTTFANIKSAITVNPASQSAAQPTAVKPSYKPVQKVEPIISQAEVPRDEAVIAPTPATFVAGVGAPVATSAGLWSSKWTLSGLVVVLLIAGGAFILL
jgi:competence protein ComEA